MLREWFLPERPGPLIGPHVIRTGNGACFVDRWPAPRAVLAETAGNYTLLGNARVLSSANLKPHIRGFVEASEEFAPLLKATCPDLKMWPRVILEQQDSPAPVVAGAYPNRRLGRADADHLSRLSPKSAWIVKTWDGPSGLAASGLARGAFAEDRLVSVACTFFLGETFEEIGVVTEPGFRGQGLSTACAWALCRDVRARGHCPSWTTSPDNTASLRVAQKLGFAVHRQDRLYVVGVPIPEPARPPGL